MVGVFLKIRKLDFRPELHRQQRREERQIFLRDLFCRQTGRLRERPFEINYRQGRVGSEDAARRYDLVALRHNRRRFRLRQIDSSLDHGLRQTNGREPAEHTQRNNETTPIHKIARYSRRPLSANP